MGLRGWLSDFWGFRVKGGVGISERLVMVYRFRL